MLRDNPTGLKPAEVWHKLKKEIPNRSYVYAVLGRLKDRDQVMVKRGGKYCYKIAIAKGEDVKEPLSVN